MFVNKASTKFSGFNLKSCLLIRFVASCRGHSHRDCLKTIELDLVSVRSPISVAATHALFMAVQASDENKSLEEKVYMTGPTQSGNLTS